MFTSGICKRFNHHEFDSESVLSCHSELDSESIKLSETKLSLLSCSPEFVSESSTIFSKIKIHSLKFSFLSFW